jgi:hypothetical protein
MRPRGGPPGPRLRGSVLPILSASVRLYGALLALYGALLALYPKAFRRRYEALQRRQVLRGMLRGDRIHDDLRSLEVRG